ncbi:MAG: UvrD-helicase domain-containing protein [Parachlamydiaceae bacterium]
MKFDVLSKKTKVRQNHFLEASAGTGKTFSIENVYARLLLENRDLTVNNILVVTFTKAAALDLTIRIKSKLKQLIKALKNPEELKPEFLKGQDGNLETLLALEDALYNFDQAAIFTIHGFCFKALQEHSFEAGTPTSASQTIAKDELIDLIRVFLLTELNRQWVSPSQLDIVLKHHGRKVKNLQEALLKLILKGPTIAPTVSYEQCFHKFKKAIEELKAEGWRTESVLNDLLSLSINYKEICDKSRNLKKEVRERYEHFASLFEESLLPPTFDLFLKNYQLFFNIFDERNKKASSKPVILNHPLLLQQIESKLLPLIQVAGNPMAILANIASICQTRLEKYLEENHKVEFSFLLKKMLRAICNHSLFKKRLQEQYKIVIIDEFQDTDPLQWEIFSNLFLNKENNHVVYLVGDPKQSIYSFRSADIYTYLGAEKRMGQASKASLATNYRSQPSLIHALNHLFNESNTPGWIDLPLYASHLPYQVVEAPLHKHNVGFKDSLGSIHFCRVKALNNEKMEVLEEALFPFFADEMRRLNLLEGIKFQDMAVLVYHHLQANRLMHYLKGVRIPSVLQKAGNVSKSLFLPAFRDLIRGFLHPKSESSLKAALCGKIIGLDYEQIQRLDDPQLYAKSLEQVFRLRESLLTDGLGRFFQKLLDSKWLEGSQTTKERLLSAEGGASYYDELMHILSLLMDYEAAHFATPDRVMQYIDELILIQDTENEDLKIHQDTTQDAVNILTIHASKGLEYGVVFALGLCHRTTIREELVYDRHKREATLAYVSKDSEQYKELIRESDAEKMRQLYVAMTRAKYRLYIPCIEGWKAPKAGSASPLELFLARIGKPFCAYHELYERLKGDFVADFKSFLARSDASITMGEVLSNDSPRQVSLEVNPRLVEPPIPQVPGEALFCSSFSSLAKHAPSPILNAPKDVECEEKNSHTLPAGRETGVLFHEMMQRIAFHQTEEEWRQIVHHCLKNHPLHGWIDVFTGIISTVLDTPLGPEKVLLKDIPWDACFKEMEFLFPKELANDLDAPPGFMNGVVDLVFQAKGKYYLLDWKTNWLGEDISFYNRDGMKKAMEMNHYFLQANIYTQAFKQYVKQFDIRPFAEIFGGSIYIFLRGVEPHSQSGIYHFFPENSYE